MRAFCILTWFFIGFQNHRHGWDFYPGLFYFNNVCIFELTGGRCVSLGSKTAYSFKLRPLEVSQELKAVLFIMKQNIEIDLSTKNVLTLKEACAYTGIARSYLYKLTSEGVIPFSKPNGKLIFFERVKLEKWMLGNRTSSVLKSHQNKLNKSL